jgi:hypothetical protein
MAPAPEVVARSEPPDAAEPSAAPAPPAADETAPEQVARAEAQAEAEATRVATEQARAEAMSPPHGAADAPSLVLEPSEGATPAPDELAEATPVLPTPRRTPTPAPPAADEGLFGDPIALGGMAAAALVLVLALFLVLRRRRKLPGDIDVTAIAEESASHGRIPSGGFAMDAAPGEAGTASQTDDFFSGDAGLPAEADDDGTAFGLERAAPVAAARPVAPSQRASKPGASIFADDETGHEPASKGDAIMNQEVSDLPADRAGAPPAPPAAPAAAGADIARLVQDLERRIGQLETRLEASNDAREKLERQVAAQSEELRVQRAAIARTQRALRSMSRADEEKATEPALRDGDTQVKTRVNV